MKTSNYSIRLDPTVKLKAEETYAELGLNLSEAINVFLHMSIKHYGFPFQVAHPVPNSTLRASFDEADVILSNREIKGYANIAELNAAMDAEDAAEDGNV